MENNNLNNNEHLAETNCEQEPIPHQANATVEEVGAEQPLNEALVEEQTLELSKVDELSETSVEEVVAEPEYEYQPQPVDATPNVSNANGFANETHEQGTKYYGGDGYGMPQAQSNAVSGYTLPKKLEDDPSNKKGMRVFAVVLVIVLLSVSLFTGGYFLGSNSTGLNRNVVTPGLESKEDAKQVSVSEVFSNVIDSVVQIRAYNSTSVSTASGVVYTEDGYIITNDHIYSEISSPKFIVTMYDGTEYEAEYVAGDARSDLAVLKIDAKGLDVATFGDSGELVVGERVAAIGYPSTSSSATASITCGIVSSVGARASTTTSYSTKFIQTDTAINPGSSGGVLVNMYSQVVGITSAKIANEEWEGIGYAIPSVSTKKIVDLLIKEGYVKGRARLGITYTEVDSVYSNVTELPRGLYVASVAADCPVAEVGLKKGDIITHVNDMSITNSGIMLDVIDSSSAGDKIHITVYDTETEQSLTYEVELAEDAGSSSYSSSPQGESGSGAKPGEDEREYSEEFNFPAGE